MATPSPQAEAAHRAALYAAEGADTAQNWDKALEFLLDAARLKHPLAQGALAGMAGQWQIAHAAREGDAYDEGRCAAFRAQFSLPLLLQVHEPNRFSSSPRIAGLQGFAAPDLCDWLIARAKDRLAPARVYNPDTGGAGHSTVRSNTESLFPLDDSDLLLCLLRSRIARAVEMPLAAMEAPTILHYNVGEEFKPHFDFLDTKHPGTASDVAMRGQRAVTFLLSLNGDFEGGETYFPALSRRYKGRKGSAIFFWNVTPEGVPDRLTAHAGLPPTRGEKWLLTQWVRGSVASL